jgi:hypothetical protein
VLTKLVIDSIGHKKSLASLQTYFGTTTWTAKPYTGAYFDTFGRCQDSSATDYKITSEDLIAVSFLSVHVPPMAARGMLQIRADEISALLNNIDPKLQIQSVTEATHDSVFGPGSPAQKLWNILRGKKDGGWDVGPTITSKIMARKRPHLIPIWDSVLKSVTDQQDDRNQWNIWRQEMTRNSELLHFLEVVRMEAGIPEIPLLRVLDVILWMSGRTNQQNEAEPGLDRVPSELAS